MSAATVHHLPSAHPSLDDIAATLTPGQWVRITWHDKDANATGTVEGTLRQASNLHNSLFLSRHFCVTARGHLNSDVTGIETKPRPDLDMEDLAPLVEDWAAASVELEEKALGRTKTGDNTAEQNALYEAEGRIRTYLRGVRL